MPSADISDIGSLEQIYGFETFQRDAGQNALGGTAMLHGVRIGSAPDATGRFDLTPAKRQTSESEPDLESAFVAAMFAEAVPGNETAPGDHSPRRRDYETFLARVVDTARKIRIRPPSGDERLQGFHGG